MRPATAACILEGRRCKTMSEENQVMSDATKALNGAPSPKSAKKPKKLAKLAAKPKKSEPKKRASAGSSKPASAPKKKRGKAGEKKKTAKTHHIMSVHVPTSMLAKIDRKAKGPRSPWIVKAIEKALR